MKLTQIDLRLPFKHKYAKEFSPESWSIPELYWSHLKEYSTGKIQKINILLSDNWDNELETPMNVAGFKESYLTFDFDTYFKLSKKDKKRMQLEAVHKGMMQIAVNEGWNTDHLLDAYNKCLDKNLEYQFDVGKPKTSPNRKYKIGFWCNWDIGVFELYWVLYDKGNNEIKRQKFLEKPPYEGEFIYYAKWKWLDNSKVLLEDKYKYGKNENWQIDLELENQVV